MQCILKEDNHYILRLDRGEEFIETLIRFAENEGINAAWFSAIGASDDAELAYYNRQTKEFFPKMFTEPLEIVNISGNIALKEGNTIVHAHGILGNKEMQLFGGHINKLIISTIAEVTLTKLEGEIRKVYSEEIGLNIMG